MRNFNQNDEQKVISYLTMRKAIGWIGILLPFALLFITYFINKLDLMNNSDFAHINCNYEPKSFFKKSISHYYYTTAGPIFVGALSAVSLFLFSYKGPKKQTHQKGFSDNFMANFAGFCALGVLIFPTSNESTICDNIHIFYASKYIGYVHYFFATLFFVTISLMCFMNFRIKNDEIPEKPENYTIYKWCGIVMLGSIVCIALYAFYLEGKKISWLDNINPTFTFETIALIAFGIAWLTKGNVNYSYIPTKIKSMLK